MKRIYFIYSSNKTEDYPLARGLHSYLPCEIDIAEGVFKKNRIIIRNGLITECDTALLRKMEKPVYFTEEAYKKLIWAREKDKEIIDNYGGYIKALPLFNSVYLENSYFKRTLEEVIQNNGLILGRKNIRAFIEKLKRKEVNLFA